MPSDLSQGQDSPLAPAEQKLSEIDRALEEQESAATLQTQFTVIFSGVAVSGGFIGWLAYQVWRDGYLGSDIGDLVMLLAFVWLLMMLVFGIGIPVLRTRRLGAEERVDRLLRGRDS